ncbi:hypothetical protein [Bradyrhizobium sp. SYSU BS000235]|uniref:hypothetical protein n=1 Tax=Bradyrhizobium sp. SYSU BS000235 TaxID=3411332 RepID=UPI003C790995
MSTPSIVPSETFYIVRDQASDGDVLREIDVRHSHFDDVLNDMVAARYHKPVAVYAFNPEEGWSRDVSEEFARELQSLIDVAQGEVEGELNVSIDEFMRRHAWHGRQLRFRL